MCVVKFLKTNDSFEGEVQSDIGIGGGDYIDFDFCLDDEFETWRCFQWGRLF